MIWFATIYAYNSWAIGEISTSQVGLTHRWIIKSILVVGLIVAVIVGHRRLAAGGDRAVGPAEHPLPADDPGVAGGGRQKIEGKERIRLEELEEATWDIETETLRDRRKPQPSPGDWPRLSDRRGNNQLNQVGGWNEVDHAKTLARGRRRSA